MTYIVTSQTSSQYWDVGERLDTVPKWATKHMEPGDIATRPICRVHKSAGKATLDSILAMPELLAAARALLALMDDVPADPTPGLSFDQNDRVYARYEFDSLRAALTKAESYEL